MAEKRIEGCILYRYFDDQGVLLYVGVTTKPRTRFCSHRSAAWAKFVARREEEHLPSESEAVAAERRAIETEGPIFNGQHAQYGRAERVAAYLGEPSELEPEVPSEPLDVYEFSTKGYSGDLVFLVC